MALLTADVAADDEEDEEEEEEEDDLAGTASSVLVLRLVEVDIFQTLSTPLVLVLRREVRHDNFLCLSFE